MSEAWTEADIARLNPGRVERIRELLTTALAPQLLVVNDDSHKHAGHAGARGGQGHFSVEIVSAAFAGKIPLARHRLGYAALGQKMQARLHSLSIHYRHTDRNSRRTKAPPEGVLHCSVGWAVWTCESQAKQQVKKPLERDAFVM